MMSRITIHLKRAGDRLRDDNITTLASPKTIFFNRHRRHSSTQFWDQHPFDTTTIMPGEEQEQEQEQEHRLSADQTPLPPSESPSTFDDHDDVAIERISTADNSSNHHHHHDLIHRPPPLVILARPKISDIQIV